MPTERVLYAANLMATSPPRTMVMMLRFFVAVSHAEAMGLGMAEASKAWPEADGWQQHRVAVLVVPQIGDRRPLSDEEQQEIAFIREAHEDHARCGDGCLSTAHLHRGRLLELLGS